MSLFLQNLIIFFASINEDSSKISKFKIRYGLYILSIFFFIVSFNSLTNI